MDNLSKALSHYEEGLESHYQSGLDARDRRADRWHRISDNLCSELDSAKLILGDRRFTFRERLDVLADRLMEIHAEVESIET
ncbi:MAG: hypothetical protein ACE14T_12255 [Syntrophales bacterium]